MNFIALGIIVSFVFAGVTFIASQNIFSSLIILAVYTAFFVLIARRQINKNEQKIPRH